MFACVTTCTHSTNRKEGVCEVMSFCHNQYYPWMNEHPIFLLTISKFENKVLTENTVPRLWRTSRICCVPHSLHGASRFNVRSLCSSKGLRVSYFGADHS